MQNVDLLLIKCDLALVLVHTALIPLTAQLFIFCFELLALAYQAFALETLCIECQSLFLLLGLFELGFQGLNFVLERLNLIVQSCVHVDMMNCLALQSLELGAEIE